MTVKSFPLFVYLIGGARPALLASEEGQDLTIGQARDLAETVRKDLVSLQPEAGKRKAAETEAAWCEHLAPVDAETVPETAEALLTESLADYPNAIVFVVERSGGFRPYMLDGESVRMFLPGGGLVPTTRPIVLGPSGGGTTKAAAAARRARRLSGDVKHGRQPIRRRSLPKPETGKPPAA